MQDRLTVGFRLKSSLAKDRPQIRMVVDFAVGDQHVVHLADRLRPVRRTDDRKPAMGHHHGLTLQGRDMNLVRAAVGDLFDHFFSKGSVVDVPQADRAAHNSSFLARALDADRTQRDARSGPWQPRAQVPQQGRGRTPCNRSSIPQPRDLTIEVAAAHPCAIMQISRALGLLYMLRVIAFVQLWFSVDLTNRPSEQ